MTVSQPVTVSNLSFITFTPDSRIVTWQTSASSQLGTYIITITGTITTIKTFTSTTSFNLFVYDCLLSPETITIIVGAVPDAKSYTVGDAFESQIIARFS